MREEGRGTGEERRRGDERSQVKARSNAAAPRPWDLLGPQTIPPRRCSFTSSHLWFAAWIHTQSRNAFAEKIDPRGKGPSPPPPPPPPPPPLLFMQRLRERLSRANRNRSPATGKEEGEYEEGGEEKEEDGVKENEAENSAQGFLVKRNVDVLATPVGRRDGGDTFGASCEGRRSGGEEEEEERETERDIEGGRDKGERESEGDKKEESENEDKEGEGGREGSGMEPLVESPNLRHRNAPSGSADSVGRKHDNKKADISCEKLDQCPLCGKDLRGFFNVVKQRHLNSCLDANAGEASSSSSTIRLATGESLQSSREIGTETLGGGATMDEAKLCPICWSDASSLNELDFEVHLNGCLDRQLENSSFQSDGNRTRVNDDMTLATGRRTSAGGCEAEDSDLLSAQYACAYCKKRLDCLSYPARVTHLKSCGKAPNLIWLDKDRKRANPATKLNPLLEGTKGTLLNYFHVPGSHPLIKKAKKKKLVEAWDAVLGRKKQPARGKENVKPNQKGRHLLTRNRGRSFQTRPTKRAKTKGFNKAPRFGSKSSPSPGGSKSSKSVPFWKLVQGTNFVVDGFHYAHHAPPKIYFLTHFHSDHYGGIARNFTAGPIYCTKVTGRLLRMHYGLCNCVNEVAMNTPVTINGMQVTFLDANHCPGSAMILFEGRGKKYLHVGDFRYHDDMKKYPKLKDLQPGELDIIYLDTTYCDPKRKFPSQQFCIDYVAKHAETALRRLGRVFICIGAYSIGKERVQLGIFARCKRKIYIDKRRYKTYEKLDLPYHTLQFRDDRKPNESPLNRYFKQAKNLEYGHSKEEEEQEQDENCDQYAGGFVPPTCANASEGKGALIEPSVADPQGVPSGFNSKQRMGNENGADISSLSPNRVREGTASFWDEDPSSRFFRRLTKEEMERIEARTSANAHLLTQEDPEPEKPTSLDSCPQYREPVREARNITDVYTSNPKLTNIHVVPMGWLNPEKLRSYAQSVGKYDRIVGFRPTGWSGNHPRCVQKGNVCVHHVPYSEHSTYTELRAFIKWLKPKRIIPTVNGKDWRNIISHFKDL